MVTFKTVKNPKRLVATPITLADVQAMEHAQQSNVGVAAGARQLNCKYRDDITYVVPVDSAVEPFKMTGYVDPADVRTWFEAKCGEASAE